MHSQLQWTHYLFYRQSCLELIKIQICLKTPDVLLKFCIKVYEGAAWTCKLHKHDLYLTHHLPKSPKAKAQGMTRFTGL